MRASRGSCRYRRRPSWLQLLLLLLVGPCLAACCRRRLCSCCAASCASAAAAGDQQEVLVRAKPLARGLQAEGGHPQARPVGSGGAGKHKGSSDCCFPRTSRRAGGRAGGAPRLNLPAPREASPGAHRPMAGSRYSKASAAASYPTSST